MVGTEVVTVAADPAAPCGATAPVAAQLCGWGYDEKTSVISVILLSEPTVTS